MTTTTIPENLKRETARALLIETGATSEQASNSVAMFDAEKLDFLIEALRTAVDERTALRERLMANPNLRRIACPANTWKEASDRFAVASRAVEILDKAAERHEITLDALLHHMIEQGNEIQETIEFLVRQGDAREGDPRFDDWGTGSFRTWRYRVGEAVELATAERTRKATAERMAREDEAWAAQGRERCDRCGGLGGSHSWPGFTCFKCEGYRSVPIA